MHDASVAEGIRLKFMALNPVMDVFVHGETLRCASRLTEEAQENPRLRKTYALWKPTTNAINKAAPRDSLAGPQPFKTLSSHLYF